MPAAHEPTDADRKLVNTLAGFGIPQEQIALRMGISLPTLHKHYRRDLDLGMIQANSLVAQSLFQKATGNGPQAVTAAIFWMKARCGWREKIELTGENGGPIQHHHTHTEESARDRIQRRIDRLAAGLPLLPAGVERDVAETEAQEDEA